MEALQFCVKWIQNQARAHGVGINVLSSQEIERAAAMGKAPKIKISKDGPNVAKQPKAKNLATRKQKKKIC